jgi:hypothetical protein
MFENPIISIDIGWRFISELIGFVFKNYNFAIVVLILINIILSSSIIFLVDNKSLLQKSIFLFLIIKWSLYEFITLRFGLASLICLIFYLKQNQNFYSKYLVTIISSLIHYSILIFSIKYIWNKKWKLAIVFIIIFLSLPIIYTLDPRILHYLDADTLEFSYSVLFTMMFFILLFYIAYLYETNKYALHQAFLLILFSVAIIYFQKFDTFNRVFFGLFILSAINWARLSNSKISKTILTFSFLLFSQIVLLRYTFFASDVNKLIYK